jgi:uncharacterized protein YdhG (YjbR/CyaY superfamily)
MKKAPSTSATVDDYIAACPSSVRAAMKQVRETILRAAPGAEEILSYRMPAIRYGEGKRPVVYYAAHANHLGLYPMTSSVRRFKHELKNYQHSAGAIQFPWNRKIPLALITRIVKFRAAEARAKLKSRPSSKA